MCVLVHHPHLPHQTDGADHDDTGHTLIQFMCVLVHHSQLIHYPDSADSTAQSPVVPFAPIPPPPPAPF